MHAADPVHGTVVNPPEIAEANNVTAIAESSLTSGGPDDVVSIFGLCKTLVDVKSVGIVFRSPWATAEDAGEASPERSRARTSVKELEGVSLVLQSSHGPNKSGSPPKVAGDMMLHVGCGTGVDRGFDIGKDLLDLGVSIVAGSTAEIESQPFVSQSVHTGTETQVTQLEPNVTTDAVVAGIGIDGWGCDPREERVDVGGGLAADTVGTAFQLVDDAAAFPVSNETEGLAVHPPLEDSETITGETFTGQDAVATVAHDVAPHASGCGNIT